MKASNLYYVTYKEDPTAAETKSHKLMLRAGMIKQQASGMYTFLPIGLKVMDKITQIVKKHMDNAGANQVLMPTAVPQEIYKSRINKFGPEMFRFKDRKDVDFCLTPTHEELFALTIKDNIKSYKQLPIMLYQVGTKFRDEIRPRNGVTRCREFIMKDAYSFDIDESGMIDSYISMYNAYVKIFNELEINYRPVLANAGQMGGSMSEEFMAITEDGEDSIVMCKKCQYAANIEKATSMIDDNDANEEIKNIEEFHTPGIYKVKDVISEYSLDPEKIVKTLIYIVEGKPVALILKGKDEIEDAKLEFVFNTTKFRPATEEEIIENVGCEAGYIGPSGLKFDIIADHNIKGLKNFITGANKKDYHIKNVNESNIKISRYEDIKRVKDGDLCPKCSNIMGITRGTEIGHIFQLGKTYSSDLGLNVLTKEGKPTDIMMGSYGIGIARTMATVVEQLSDEKGIVWPDSIAPFNALVLAVNNKNEEQVEAANKAYELIKEKGADVIIDDRNLSFSQRIKDAELIGIPYIIIAGKKSNMGIYEFVTRKTGDKTEIALDELIIK